MMDKIEAHRMIDKCTKQIEKYSNLKRGAIFNHDHWSANKYGEEVRQFTIVRTSIQKELDK